MRNLPIKFISIILSHAFYSFLPLIRFIRKMEKSSNLVILTYHRVRERTGIFYDRNINASPLEFRRQMEYIKKKFNLISMSELVECYEQKRNLKPNSLMVTFDDGYRDVAFNAFPILKELGIPAVAFLITGVIDTDAISWEDQISFIFQTIPNGTVKITEDAVYSLKSPGEKDISLWQVCKKLKEIRSIERNRIINELIETYQIDVEQMGKL